MTSVLLPVRIGLWRARYLLWFAALLGLVWVVARGLAPPPPPTVAVVVTARDVAAGAPLTTADLRVARVPPSVVPAGSMTRTEEAVGSAPVVSLPPGVPVLPALLGQDRFGLAPPAGTVTVPVRLADPAVAGLLRPGDRIDLVAPGHEADRAVVLARRAVVLDVVTDESGETGWLGAGETSGMVTVVAVSAAEGHLLAGSGWGSLGAVLVEGS